MKLIATLIILLSIFTTEFSESKQLSKANRKTKSYFSEANTFSHKYYPNFVGNRWVLRSTVEPVEEHVVEITLTEIWAIVRIPYGDWIRRHFGENAVCSNPHHYSINFHESDCKLH